MGGQSTLSGRNGSEKYSSAFKVMVGIENDDDYMVMNDDEMAMAVVDMEVYCLHSIRISHTIYLI